MPVTFQRRHGRGYAVVGETGRHGDHGKSLLKRRVLDRVDEAPPPMPTTASKFRV